MEKQRKRRVADDDDNGVRRVANANWRLRVALFESRHVFALLFFFFFPPRVLLPVRAGYTQGRLIHE